MGKTPSRDPPRHNQPRTALNQQSPLGCAKRLHDRNLPAPKWTRKTSLEENWNPYAEANPRTPPIQDFWDMIHTTPEFIEKAIIYPKQDLVNL